MKGPRTNFYIALGSIVAIVLIVFLVALSLSRSTVNVGSDTTGQAYLTSDTNYGTVKAVVTTHPISTPELAYLHLRSD